VLLPGCRRGAGNDVADPGALQVTRYRVTEAQSVGMTYIIAEVTNPAAQPVPGASLGAVLRGAAGESLGTGNQPLPPLKPGETCVTSFAIASHGKHKDVEFAFALPTRGKHP
jgi:hypothetical protein